METRNKEVINPEIPETPEEKLALLNFCIEALSTGGRVEGVTPRHVGPEGALILHQQRTSMRLSSPSL